MADGRRALVVGLGIAGLAAAKQLSEAGWEVSVVERSPARRTGGYFIALFATGRASAERLGILDLLPSRAKPGAQTWEVRRDGRRSPGMSIASVPDGPRLLIRGDVEDALYSVLPENVRVRFATVPVRIEQDADGVDVDLRHSDPGGAAAQTRERFDLVLGADGVRSTVRRLVFGPDANFVHDLDYVIAATLLDSEVTGFDRGDGLVISEPGRSATTFAFADAAPGLLFSYRAGDPRRELTKTPIDALRAAFGPEPTGPVLGELLDRFAAADRPLFDIAQQVRMRQWHSGRVALIGDAAWCMTLYSGLGASSGIAGAELLGTLLRRHDHDVLAALPDWNTRMRPFVDYQHRTVEQSRFIFTSADRRQHVQRRAMMRAMSMPLVRRAMGRAMTGGTAFRMKAVDIGAA